MNIYVWLCYEFSVKRFGYLSIPLLAKKLVRDLLTEGLEKQVQFTFLIPESHRALREGFFPDENEFSNLRFMDVQTRYIGGRLQFLSSKEFNPCEANAVVLNLEPVQARALEAAFTKTFTFVRPEIVNYVLFSPNESDIPESRKQEVALILAQGRTVFNGPASREQFRVVQDTFLKPEVVRAGLRECAVVPLGVDIPALEASRRERVRGEEVRFLYGGRLDGHKGVEKTLSIVQTLFERGLPVTYTVQTTGKNSCAKLEKLAGEFSFVRPLYNQARSVFYENAFTHDVFICASRVETFGLSFFEMMYAGMVGIFFRQDWQRGLLERVYLVDDVKGATDVALHVVRHLEEVQGQWKQKPLDILETMNSTTQNRKILEYLLHR